MNDTPDTEHPKAEGSRCPICGKEGFWGYCMTTRSNVLSKCWACGYVGVRPVPTFTKSIVYLDQFVISNIVKAKDPFWTGLSGRLKKLISTQLVVCPYSPLHSQESMLFHDRGEALQEAYKSLGGNDRLHDPNKIREAQLVRSLRAYLGREEPGTDPLDWRDAFAENPHLYTGDMVVTVIGSHHPFIISTVRQRKNRLFDSLEGLRSYRQHNPASFNEDLNAEFEGFANGMMVAYRERAPALSPAMRLLDRLASEVRSLRPDHSHPMQLVEEFLGSEHVRRAPFLDIGCKLEAVIAERERNPKGSRPRKASDSYDVDMLSHYAPYCDAMFVDNEFRAMASDGRVTVEKRYGVKLFSEKKQGRADFLAYLDGLWSLANDEHWDKVAACDPSFASTLSAIRRLKNQLQVQGKEG